MYLRENDTISGKMAKAYIIINNQVEELFYAKSLEATIEKNKVDVPVLGRTNTPQRSAGWSGSGTLTIYYVTSLFRRLRIRKASTHVVKEKGGRRNIEIQPEIYLAKIAAASVVFPDLKNAELQQSYGALGAEDLLKKCCFPASMRRWFKKCRRSTALIGTSTTSWMR